MRIVGCLSLVATLACNSLLGPNDVAGSESIVSGGRTRTFSIHLPRGYSRGNSYPLLVAFHGAGSSGSAMQRMTRFDDSADQSGFIAVYPDAAAEARATWALGCAQCTWADAAGIDDYRLTRDLIDSLVSRYGVDRKRVFVAGHSLGGSFAFDVACHEPGLVAGAAIVSSLPSVEELALCRPASRPVTVITAVGEFDGNVPWNGGTGGGAATYQDAEHTAADWAARSHCGVGPTRRSFFLEYSGCTDGVLVRFARVPRAGHEWPTSSDFGATAEIANMFFKR